MLCYIDIVRNKLVSAVGVLVGTWQHLLKQSSLSSPESEQCFIARTKSLKAINMLCLHENSIRNSENKV
ncbi:hypothetical protein Ahy_B08g093888 isoform C [Arachis hypogaea]|uniref:Uncharacterized protein n=1 Tax=Arachis hypogaea TaxID=3818 RepID=A0A444Y775_ARAHY|nr:hypothetical protein Ahy_B08g093888 isoform C [Arachis hypogaea]